LIKLFSIIAIFMLSACSIGGSPLRATDPPFRPVPPDNVPQEYRQGWLDGCDTGFGAHGSDLYRWEYKFKQDPSQIMNPVYYKAWKDAENYCRTYIAEYTQRSLVPWCSLDGITDDCSDNTSYNSVPFFGTSTESYYGVFGGAGVDSLMGDTRGVGALMGGNEDGISDVLGWGALPGMQGTW
jgi:hypothetical protein